MGRNHQNNLFYPLAGGISSHLMPFIPPKWPQIVIFGHLHVTCAYESVWIPPFCPVYYQGEHILQLYGLYTHVHRDSSWFWDVIICRKPKKHHFSHFSLSPGAGIIILQPPKAAFCEGGTMAHQNLKRKWGVTMLLSELPRLERAKRGKNGIFGTNSNNYTHNIPRHPLGWTWNLKLTPLPIFLTNKIKTFYGKLTQARKNSNLLKSWLRWKPSWPGGLRPSHQNFGNSVPLSELVGNG